MNKTNYPILIDARFYNFPLKTPDLLQYIPSNKNFMYY